MSTSLSLVDTQGLDKELTALRARLEAIVVVDAPSCLTAKQGQRDVRDYMKMVHARLDPFVLSAKKNLDGAKDELNRYIAPAEFVDHPSRRR